MNRTSIKTIDLKSPAIRWLGIFVLLFLAVMAFYTFRWSFGYTLALRSQELEHAQMAVELAPDAPQAHYSLFRQLDKTFIAADSVRAIQELETATALSPQNYLLWLELGKARERSGDIEGSEQALRRAAALAPNYASVQWALGNMLLRSGRTDEAFQHIRTAVSSDTSFAAAAVISAFQAAGDDPQTARRWLGDSPPLLAEFAVLLVTQKRFDDAEEVWRALPKQNAEYAEIRPVGDTLARYLLDAKQFRFAREVFMQNGSDLSDGIGNGGFESAMKAAAGPFEWQIDAGNQPRIGPADGQKHAGNFSLLVGFGEGTKEFRGVSQLVAVKPGETAFHIFYRANMNGSRGKLRWEITDAATGRIIAATEPLSLNAEWQPAAVQFTVPAGTEAVTIRLARTECPPTDCYFSGNVWFDDAELK